jgi:hypothetical protein
MTIYPNIAEIIVDNILSTNDEILAALIIDMKGNILATKSKESFKKASGVTLEWDKYGRTVVAVLHLINHIRNVTGEAKAIITMHENCKMMLLPLPSFQILVGLVLLPSVNTKDYNIAGKIEKLVADTLWHI